MPEAPVGGRHSQDRSILDAATLVYGAVALRTCGPLPGTTIFHPFFGLVNEMTLRSRAVAFSLPVVCAIGDSRAAHEARRLWRRALLGDPGFEPRTFPELTGLRTCE